MQVPASRSSLSVYLSEVGRHPLIDSEEEKRLMIAYRRTGDHRIAQKLVARFLSTFVDFPPRQKAASFSIDQVLEKLSQPGGSH